MQNRLKKIYSLLSIVYIVFLVYFMNNIPAEIPYLGSYITVTFIPLILFLSKDSGFSGQILDNKLFISLGSFSYAIYIFHFPIREVFLKFMPKLNNIYFIFYFIIVILWSITMTFFNKKISVFFKTRQNKNICTK